MRRLFTYAASVVSAMLLVALLPLAGGCSTKSLLTERYEEDFYEIETTLPDSLEAARYSFLVYGDTQSGWRAERSVQSEKWRSWKQLYLPVVYPLYLVGKGLWGAGNWARGVPDYGADQRRAVQKALVREVDRSDARFLVHLGDVGANDGRKAYHWNYFLKDNRDYASPVGHVPLLAIPGNHDYINTEYGLKNWQTVFDRPLFYVQESPSAAVFFLNSNLIVDQHQEIGDERQEALFRKWFVSADSSKHSSWLERQLEAHADVPFKIVAMHHPLVSFSWHHEDWYDETFGPDLSQKRDALVRLLQEHGVQVVFSGHEHLYQHSLITLPERPAAGRAPLHQIISSGGGVPPREAASPEKVREREANFRQSGFDASMQKQASVYHYTRVDAAPDTLTLSTYEVEEESGRRARRIEQVRIPAPPPPAQAQQALGSPGASMQ